MPECFVAKASDLHDGDRRIVVAGSEEIGVFYKDGAYYAYSNYCVHSGGPACEGIMINRVVDIIADDRTYQGQTFSDEVHFVCPWHGYEFELKTGECVGDRRLQAQKYDVVQRGDDIYVVAEPLEGDDPWIWPRSEVRKLAVRRLHRPASTSSTPPSRRASATTRTS